MIFGPVLAFTAFALLTASITINALAVVARSSVMVSTKSPPSLTATGARFLVVVVMVASRNPVFCESC